MAIILNCMILLLGILCFHSLPLREYPNISFPVITISTNYPNASPELVESVVTNPLEEQLAGVEGLESIISRSNTGNSYITLRFRPGMPMEKALNATHEAARLAQAQLPAAVKAPVIERQKQSDGLPFIGIALESSSLNFGELTHYANLNLKMFFAALKASPRWKYGDSHLLIRLSLIKNCMRLVLMLMKWLMQLPIIVCLYPQEIIKIKFLPRLILS